MSKYDGLIIPRSYSDYLNKTDAATLSQMLDSLGGSMDAVPTKDSVKAARSGGIYATNLILTANSRTFTGQAISAGSIVRVMFTAALTGSDGTTGLTLTYNTQTYAVKAGKDGALADVLAQLVGEDYVYVQAYTTLELMFDGTKFIIMGNPVLISNADLSVYADGSIIYTSTAINNLRPQKIYEQKISSFNVDIGSVELVLLDWRGYAGYYWIGLIFSFQSSVNISPISTNTATSPISNNGHTINVGYEGQQPMVTRYKMNNIDFY